MMPDSTPTWDATAPVVSTPTWDNTTPTWDTTAPVSDSAKPPVSHTEQTRTAVEQSALGVAAREVQTHLFPAGTGLAGAVGGAALGGLAGPAAPVTVPLGAIGGYLLGEYGGTHAQRWMQRLMSTPEEIVASDAALAEGEQQHPFAATLGQMVASVPGMFSGGAEAKLAIGATKAGREALALVKAAEVAEETAKKSKTLLDIAASRIAKDNANLAIEALTKTQLLPSRLAGSAVSFAAMGGGGVLEARARGEAGADEKNIWDEIAKGAVTGGVMGFVPEIKTLLGSELIGRYVAEPVVQSVAMAASDAVYNNLVHGKAIDFEELAKQTGKDIPAFMIMNAVMGVLHGRAARLPEGKPLTALTGGKSDAIQEPSTAGVDVRQPSGDGEAVGGTYPQGQETAATRQEGVPSPEAGKPVEPGYFTPAAVTEPVKTEPVRTVETPPGWDPEIRTAVFKYMGEDLRDEQHLRDRFASEGLKEDPDGVTAPETIDEFLMRIFCTKNPGARLG